MGLQTEHIQHYPIGGENALRIQFTDPNYKKLHNQNINLMGQVTGSNTFDQPGSVFFYVACDNGLRFSLALDDIKPILRPMSDLYREIDGKTGIVELAKIIDASLIWNVDRTIVFGEFWRGMAIGLDSIGSYQKNFWFRNNGFHLELQLENQIIIEGIPSQFKLFQWLFDNHYDIFDLISQGLAIDINTI